MSSSEKPAEPDEVNRTKSDNLSAATKSTPHISHNDKLKSDKKQVNRSSRFSQSDGSIIKPEEGAASKKKPVKSAWSRAGKEPRPAAEGAEKDAVEVGLVAELDSLNFNNEGGEDTWLHSELVHARDSLENLGSPRNSRLTSGDVGNSKSTSFPLPQEKHNLSENPYSDSSIGNSGNEASCSTMRVLTWDPWDRMGRKAKKENKRRKMTEKFQVPPKPAPVVEETPQETQNKEEKEKPLEEAEEAIESYEYKPYQPPSKTVEFTNEVMVVYFNGDEVVGESKEPLKKELEQQLRNKEMRKGHMPTMLGTKRKFPEDFKGAWF